jgi:hypothetical protein
LTLQLSLRPFILVALFLRSSWFFLPYTQALYTSIAFDGFKLEL